MWSKPYQPILDAIVEEWREGDSNKKNEIVRSTMAKIGEAHKASQSSTKLPSHLFAVRIIFLFLFGC